MEIDLGSVANMFRSGSRAWANAKDEAEQVEEVKCGALRMRNTKPMQGVITDTFGYLRDRCGMGVECLLQDKFIVEYDLRCNMNQPARYEVDCLELSFLVQWQKRKVKALFYDGELRKVKVPSDIQSILTEGRFMKLTELIGLTDVTDCDTRSVRLLLPFIRRCTVGENKLTRLVKGCLLYLDHLEKGPGSYDMQPMRTLNYSLKSLISALDYAQTAYVFCDDDNVIVQYILYSMCEEYPHPVMGGCQHICVPADARQVVLVGYDPCTLGQRVKISAPFIWASLLYYSKMFELGQDLETALLIACSLRENRYLKEVGLPKVISGVDLVYPILAGVGCSGFGITGTPILSSGSAFILGRVQQMMIMALVKDVGTSIQCTIPNDYQREMRSLLFGNSVLLEYIDDKTNLDLMKMTRPMIWTNYLDDDDIELIMNTSVFEGFWLVKNPKKVLQRGIISALKRGMKYTILPMCIMKVDHFAVLLNEIRLGGGNMNHDMPNGMFNVRLSCFDAETKEHPPIVFEHKGHLGEVFSMVGQKCLVYECDSP